MARDRPGRRSRWFRALPVVAWMALIFALSAQPDLPHPSQGWLHHLLSGGAHLLLFGVLACLWRWALDGYGGAAGLALALTLLYGLSDEFHQSFVPGRTPDALDLVFDGLGAVLGLGIWGAVRRLRAAGAARKVRKARPPGAR